MLLKVSRLKLRQQKDFFTSANKIYSPLFTLFIKKNTDNFRTAIIVPKKAIKLASKRNKVKRQIQNMINERYFSLKNKKISVVIVINKNTFQNTPLEFKKELLRKINEVKI